jgi:hypothetical protein
MFGIYGARYWAQYKHGNVEGYVTYEDNEIVSYHFKNS